MAATPTAFSIPAWCAGVHMILPPAGKETTGTPRDPCTQAAADGLLPEAGEADGEDAPDEPPEAPPPVLPLLPLLPVLPEAPEDEPPAAGDALPEAAPDASPSLPPDLPF